MSYWFWVPIALILNILGGIVSAKNSREGGWWGLAAYATCFITIWPVLSRYTPPSELGFVAFLFDALILIGYTIGLWYMQVYEEFSTINIIGAIMAILGLVLVKWPK